MDGLSSDDELSPKEQAHATSAKKEVMEQAKRWETPHEAKTFHFCSTLSISWQIIVGYSQEEM